MVVSEGHTITIGGARCKASESGTRGPALTKNKNEEEEEGEEEGRQNQREKLRINDWLIGDEKAGGKGSLGSMVKIWAWGSLGTVAQKNVRRT